MWNVLLSLFDFVFLLAFFAAAFLILLAVREVLLPDDFLAASRLLISSGWARARERPGRGRERERVRVVRRRRRRAVRWVERIVSCPGGRLLIWWLVGGWFLGD